MAVALIYGGGPGSGKTTQSRLAEERLDRYRICPDELKYEVPNYNAVLHKDPDKARVWVHEAVGKLTKQKIAEAIIRKMDFIYDSTMSGNYAHEFVKLLLECGYDVDIIFFDVDLDTALKRMEARDNRTIPFGVLLAYHQQAAANFFRLRSMPIRSAILYNTNEGTKLVYHMQFGSKVIFYGDLYSAFNCKANELGDGSGVDVFDTPEDIKELKQMIKEKLYG